MDFVLHLKREKREDHFNAANELAVSKFLDRKIKYLEIPEIIEHCMQAHKTIADPSVDEILQTEQEVYEQIESRW